MGTYSILSVSPGIWGKEGLFEIKKVYANTALSITLLGSFTESRPVIANLDVSSLPTGYAYFQGFWLLKAPKS